MFKVLNPGFQQYWRRYGGKINQSDSYPTNFRGITVFQSGMRAQNTN